MLETMDRPSLYDVKSVWSTGNADMRVLLRLFALAILGVTAVSCHQPSSPPNPTGEARDASAHVQVSTQTPEAAAESTNVQIYSVRGVALELKADSRTVVIKHEAVPDFMPAMTMPFEARDGTQLQNVAPGDEVTFRLHVSEQDNWIDEVRRTGKTSPVDIPGSETVRIIKPLKVGDAVPDSAFTNELGQPISLGQFKGQALVATFIFTRCPVPNFCRRMSANFVEASEKLKAMKTPRNWHLLSISFDPEFDTPATLKQYAERYNYDPEKWSFVTSEMIDMDAMTGRFGLVVRRDGTDLDHNLRTVVIDTEGKVRRIFVGNEWTPDDLVREIVRAARAGKRG